MEDTYNTAIPTKKRNVELDIYQKLKNSVYTELHELPTTFEMNKLATSREEGLLRIKTLYSAICTNDVKQMEHYALLGIELAHQKYRFHAKCVYI